MTEENLDKLVINYLSEEQYEELKENGEINENELYCTPDNDTEREKVLFQGQLKGDDIISLDVNKYKKLRVYATFNTYVNVVYEIDLENPFELVHLSGYSHGASGVCQATDAPQILYVSSLYVSEDKKKLYHHKIGYISGGNWVDRGVNSGTNYKYYIYKIVGVNNNVEELVTSNPNTYSSEEQVIGTWIDGKPIYRKVFTTTTQSDAITEKTLITNPVSNLDTLVKIDGLIKGNNYWKINQQFDPTGSNSNYFATYYYNVNNNDIRGQVGNALTSKPITFILEYTKTTD